MSYLFTPDNTIVLHNPASGPRSAKTRVETLLSLLHGENYFIQTTRCSGHATELAAQAAEDNKQSVIIIGGDGTLYEVLKGAPPSLALAYYPGGSVNLFAHNHKIPRDPYKWMNLLQNGNTKSIRFGLANGSPFGAVASMGIDSYVVAHLSLKLKKAVGVAAYGIQLFTNFVSYKVPNILLTIDGKKYDEHILGILIGRGSYYAGHYRVLPDCGAEAPVLSYAIMTGDSKFNYLRYGMGMLTESMIRQRGVISGLAEEIQIDTQEQAPVQVDGDYFGEGSVKFGTENFARKILA